MKKKSLLMALTLIISLFVSGLRVQAESLSDSVNVPDKNLKKLINITLQKEEDSVITKADMASLKQLDSNALPLTSKGVPRPTHGIKELKGLEFATNLESVIFNQNDIKDLSPLAKLEKLIKVDVSMNTIADFSPIKHLVDSQYIDGSTSGKKATVVASGQFSPYETLEVSASPEGGKVTIELPKISGYEDADKHLSSVFGHPTLIEISFPAKVDHVTIDHHDHINNTLTLNFDNNLIGQKLDINESLLIKYLGTDLRFEQPIHITQEPGFEVSLSLENNKQILNMSTEDYVSTPRVEGKILKDGNAVNLKDVKIDFPQTKDFDQSIFEVKDLKIEKNNFSFNIAKKADAANPPCGHFGLSPTIKFQVEGDDNWYEFPEHIEFYNVFISDLGPFEITEEIVFDLSKDAETEGRHEGHYYANEYKLNIPTDREIGWIRVKNGNGKQVYNTKTDPDWKKGDRTILKLPLTPEEMTDSYEIIVFLNNPPVKEPNITFRVNAKYVYSKKDGAIEHSITHNLGDGIKVGESKEVELNYKDRPCTGFDITPANPKLLSAEGRTLKGLAEGKTNITLNGININYVLEEVEFASVEYLNPVTIDVAVKPGKAPVTPQDPGNQGSDSNNPLTGDNADIIFYITLGALALGSVIYLFSKRKIKN